MKLNKLAVMTFATALALSSTSCTNDDLTGEGNQKEVIEGQKTWAMVNFDIRETTSRAVGEDGAEAGTTGESAVTNVDLYIFDQNDQLELHTRTAPASAESSNLYDGHYLAPASAVEVTSGKKTFCVILNQKGNVSTDTGTALETFLRQTQVANDYAALTTGGFMSTNGNQIMMTGKSGEVILHSGVSQKDAQDAANSATLEDDEAHNVITMFVNRGVAKLGLKLSKNNITVTSLDVNNSDDTKIAVLSNVTYKANNIANESYYFLQDVDANEVYPTPNYTVSNWATDWNTKWYDMKASDPSQFVQPETTIYLTPNTHEQNKALIGNTTYALVKGVYKPESTNTVSGYTPNTQSAFTTGGTLTSGQKTIFSNDYDVAFSSLPLGSMALQDLLATTPLLVGQLQALVAKRVAEKYSAENDITPAEIEFLKDSVTYANTIKTGKSQVYAYLAPVTYMYNGVKTNKEGHYTILMKRWSLKMGETVATEDESFNLTPLSICVYNVVTVSGTTGLDTYYRVNIHSVPYAVAHPMYYSVVPNYSYHADVTKVSKIGENTEPNVDLPGEEEQEKPIEEATTFMQCSIYIYKWVGSNMNVELK